MAAAAFLPSSARDLATWQRDRLGPRTVAVLVIVLVHLLLLLAVMFARAPRLAAEPPPTIVRFIPLPPAAAPAPKPRAVSVHHSAAARAPVPIVHVPVPKNAPPALFKTEMFDAVDISKLPSHKGEQSADGSAAAGSGTDSGTAYGPGAGPGGARLYNAEWYREPTDAEVAPYLAKTRAQDGGTADIACKTIEHFGVEDCFELGETPPGSGLSRAIREAAWQFKVRPPRIGGKSEVGAWVRIHYVITVRPKDQG